MPAVSGPPTLRRRQRPPHAVDGVVVQLAELLGRAAPVADVGLVPGLPVPGLDLGLAVLLDAVLRPLVDEVAPLLEILRGVGPAGVDLVVLRGRRPRVLVGLRLHRHRLRHEADLDVRLDAALEIRVEDAVDDGPVVDRLAAGILGVGVGRAPLERRRAVAGDEQAVGAEDSCASAPACRCPRSASCRPSCRRSWARRRRRSARSA